MSKLAHSCEETMEKIERQHRARGWFLNDEGYEVSAGSAGKCPECSSLNWRYRDEALAYSAHFSCGDCGHAE